MLILQKGEESTRGGNGRGEDWVSQTAGDTQHVEERICVSDKLLNLLSQNIPEGYAHNNHKMYHVSQHSLPSYHNTSDHLKTIYK
jgi:hypothetical protein